jgi:hypothetical protein
VDKNLAAGRNCARFFVVKQAAEDLPGKAVEGNKQE